MENPTNINDKTLNTQIKRSIQQSGQWPDHVRLSFEIPVDVAMEFLIKFEKQRFKRVADNSFIKKSDVVSQLMWFWVQNKSVDFKENIFNQIVPNSVKEYNPTGIPGRPSKK